MMMSRIFSAYVAGLCPLLDLMDPAKQGPDHHRRSRPVAARDETSADVASRPPRRKRLLLVALALGLAIGTWQLLSRSGQAAEFAARDSATQTSAPAA
jgi:hypothetical protein